MRRLTIDIGNTRTKLALFEERELVWSGVWSGEWPEAERSIVSVTGVEPAALPAGVVRVSSGLRIPVTIDYKSPESLGSDRIAAVSGAWRRGEGGVVVIDAGTCVTVDYVDGEGVYRGGAIMPGLRMKFEALHNFTAKLPLLYVEDLPAEVEPIGKSTRESLESGVVKATRYALEKYVEEAERREGKKVRVVVTGGDAKRVKGEWEEDEMLVMRGMNEILMQN